MIGFRRARSGRGLESRSRPTAFLLERCATSCRGLSAILMSESARRAVPTSVEIDATAEQSSGSELEEERWQKPQRR